MLSRWILHFHTSSPLHLGLTLIWPSFHSFSLSSRAVPCSVPVQDTVLLPLESTTTSISQVPCNETAWDTAMLAQGRGSHWGALAKPFKGPGLGLANQAGLQVVIKTHHTYTLLVLYSNLQSATWSSGPSCLHLTVQYCFHFVPTGGSKLLLTQSSSPRRSDRLPWRFS